VAPAAEINTVADVFADPQFIHRAMRIDRDGIAGIRTPIMVDGSPAAAPRRAPGLGEHGQEILREIGLG
jgi:crotonobetainyl-CoA:carnitine CoA-transferase CaiB-like acyl-CoA transferase